MPGYYLVHIGCFKLPILCPRKPSSKQHSNVLQLTPNGPSMCYPFSSPRMSNKKELPGGSIKQSAQASCSRVAMATIWCILNALACGIQSASSYCLWKRYNFTASLGAFGFEYYLVYTESRVYWMLKHLPGYYLVHSERFELPIWCQRKPSSKQHSNVLQLTHIGSSMCYPFSSPLKSNEKELLRGSIKQSTQASCSRVAMATIWCITTEWSGVWNPKC